MNKGNICIIRAKLKKDYVYDAISHYGYHIQTPYVGNNVFCRIFREIWFRCKIPGKEIWFRKLPSGISVDKLLVFDPIIIPGYIEWLHKQCPKADIVLSYENRADKTISPDKVPDYVDKRSYDKDDCKKYSMKWNAPSYFIEYKRKQKDNPRYDIVYVGRDKGRLKYLQKLEEKFKKLGLKTYFHICANRQFMEFKNKAYKKIMPYEDYLDLLVDTKAILNIVPEGQTSITQREMEAAFDGVKCITNNEGIKDFELYDDSIYYFLDEDSNIDITAFLQSKTKTFDYDTLELYDFKNRIHRFFE